MRPWMKACGLALGVATLMCGLTVTDASACRRRTVRHRHVAVHFHRRTPVRTVVRTVYVDRPVQVAYRDNYYSDYAPVRYHVRSYEPVSYGDYERCRPGYSYSRYRSVSYREPSYYRSSFHVRFYSDDYRRVRYHRHHDCP